MMKNYKIVIAAIAGIVILEGIALFKGFDGIVLTTVIAAIVGLGGWSLPQPKIMKEN